MLPKILASTSVSQQNTGKLCSVSEFLFQKRTNKGSSLSTKLAFGSGGDDVLADALDDGAQSKFLVLDDEIVEMLERRAVSERCLGEEGARWKKVISSLRMRPSKSSRVPQPASMMVRSLSFVSLE